MQLASLRVVTMNLQRQAKRLADSFENLARDLKEAVWALQESQGKLGLEKYKMGVYRQSPDADVAIAVPPDFLARVGDCLTK